MKIGRERNTIIVNRMFNEQACRRIAGLPVFPKYPATLRIYTQPLMVYENRAVAIGGFEYLFEECAIWIAENQQAAFIAATYTADLREAVTAFLVMRKPACEGRSKKHPWPA